LSVLSEELSQSSDESLLESLELRAIEMEYPSSSDLEVVNPLEGKGETELVQQVEGKGETDEDEFFFVDEEPEPKKQKLE
jgi:hypothetical protein